VQSQPHQRAAPIPRKAAVAAVSRSQGPVKFIKYWIPVIIYAIVIFYMSSVQGEDIPSLFAYQDVVAHIVEYALFAVLINRAVKAYFPHLAYRSRFLWIVFYSMLYALTDEFHQSFVTGRVPSLVDVSYDCIGICLTNILYR
jgi:VanZ family protein